MRSHAAPLICGPQTETVNVCLAGWVSFNMAIFFGILRVIGMFRVDPKDEEDGLDHSYHGGSAYGDTTGEFKPTYSKVRRSSCQTRCPTVATQVGAWLLSVQRYGLKRFNYAASRYRSPCYQACNQATVCSVFGHSHSFINVHCRFGRRAAC